VNPSGGACPQDHVFGVLVSTLTVDETITTGANAVVTAITDTVSQAVPEPSSLALLGGALLGLWWSLRRGVPKALET
jgi:hypothetical protein